MLPADEVDEEVVEPDVVEVVEEADEDCLEAFVKVPHAHSTPSDFEALLDSATIWASSSTCWYGTSNSFNKCVTVWICSGVPNAMMALVEASVLITRFFRPA